MSRRHYRPATGTFRRKPADERRAEILEHVQRGVTEPAEIAKALGVKKEAVLYHARRMPEIELIATRTTRVRAHMQLALVTPHSPSEDAAA